MILMLCRNFRKVLSLQMHKNSFINIHRKSIPQNEHLSCWLLPALIHLDTDSHSKSLSQQTCKIMSRRRLIRRLASRLLYAAGGSLPYSPSTALTRGE